MEFKIGGAHIKAAPNDGSHRDFSVLRLHKLFNWLSNQEFLSVLEFFYFLVALYFGLDFIFYYRVEIRFANAKGSG